MTGTPIDYGDHSPQAGSDQLQQLSMLVDEMEAKEAEIAQIEQALKDRRSELRSIAQNKIPSLMQQVGVKTLTTGNGVTVALRTIYRASPKVSDREKAWEWLEENGHGGLLKDVLAVSFAKGEDEKAAALEEQLRQKYMNVKRDRNVHPQTLKAWLKEMIESGRNIPMDIFGAEVIEEAQVKRSS